METFLPLPKKGRTLTIMFTSPYGFPALVHPLLSLSKIIMNPIFFVPLLSFDRKEYFFILVIFNFIKR